MNSRTADVQMTSSFSEGDRHDEFTDKTNLLIESKPLLSGDSEFATENAGSKQLNIDDIAESLHCGLFQFLCNIVCGLCFTAEGLIIQSTSIIVMSACDLDITAQNRIWLSMSLLIGIAISSAFWGRLGDSFGRRKVLIVALSINVIFTIAAALSYDYSMLVIMTFFNGLGCGGVLPVTLTYAIEFFPRKYRGISASASNAYWCFGNIYAALMALWIITPSVAISVGNKTLVGWRIFTLVCAIPPSLALICLSFMPNSPRFLIKQGQSEKALQVLHKIHRINDQCCHRHNKQSVDIKLSDLSTIVDSGNKEVNENYNYAANSFTSKVRNALRQYVLLYSTKWRKQTLLVTITWILFCFCTNGLWLWLPTFFALNTQGGNCHHSQTSINSTSDLNTSTQALNQTLSCIARTHDTTIYRDLLLTTFSAIFIEIIFIPIINLSGRRLLFGGLATATSICIFCMWLVNTSTSILIFSCLFTGLSGSAWNILNVWTSELYPTHLRSTSNGWVNFCGRIGAMIGTMSFGLLLNYGCNLPVIIVGTACAIAAGLSFILPDTTKAEIN